MGARLLHAACARVVPASQHGRVALVAEHADGRRRQVQPPALRGVQRDPAGAEHAQHVAVGEDSDLAVDAGQLGDHPVGSRAHLRGALAAGTAVAPQAPAGPSGEDLRRGEALVVAVVPLHQLGALLCLRAQPAQIARFARARQGADQHQRKAPRGQALGQRGCPVPSTFGERDVDAPSVPAIPAPLGLCVADEYDLASARGAIGLLGWLLPAHLAGPPGAAASSTITVSRSRLSRLAGTWRLGWASIAATASALPAPVASRTQLCAARSTARLSVMRSGGGLGESRTPRHTASSPASSVLAPGNRDATWPSGPMPSTTTSSTGELAEPACSLGTRSHSSSA